MSADTTIWRGEPGHFISNRKCCWHLCTDILGTYRVSSVGCYHPVSDVYERTLANREGVGLDRLYETMVFPLVGDDDFDHTNELDMKGYNDRDEAERGHLALVEVWTERAKQ